MIKKEFFISTLKIWMIQIISALYVIPFAIWNKYWYGDPVAFPRLGNLPISELSLPFLFIFLIISCLVLAALGYHILAGIPIKDIRLVVISKCGSFGIYPGKMPVKIHVFRKILILPLIVFIPLGIIGEFIFHHSIWSWMIMLTLIITIMNIVSLILIYREKGELFVVQDKYPQKFGYTVIDWQYLQQHYPEYAEDSSFPQYQH